MGLPADTGAKLATTHTRGTAAPCAGIGAGGTKRRAEECIQNGALQLQAGVSDLDAQLLTRPPA
jgi:hypothetical protein